jgi:hypothetical protein
MTLLISWIGVDVKKEGNRIGSIYIASDSRYSWDDYSTFDLGSKVLGSSKFPEIFGFCGDVTFAKNVLMQLLQQIDNGLLLSEKDDHVDKNNKIFSYIKTSFIAFPKGKLKEGFTILHATRVKNEFFCFRTSGKSNASITNFQIELPKVSFNIFSEGSGKREFDNNFHKWEKETHNNFRTSRAVYHCLEETLERMKDKRTGGKPQVIGLYRIRNSVTFGILHNGKRFLNGMEVDQNVNAENIEWRNELFERIDPSSLGLIMGAQRQPK